MANYTPSPKDEHSSRNMSDEQTGITIPEEFQQQVHGLLKSATTKYHLNHIRDRVYAKEDELRKADEAKMIKNKPLRKGPEEFSTAEMPK